MNDCDVLFLCLDLVLIILVRSAYISPRAENWHVVRALCWLVGYVTVTLSLLALARLLGGCAWWSIGSSYVLGFLIVEVRIWKMIKAPIAEGCLFDVKQT